MTSSIPSVGTRVIVNDQGTRGHLGVRIEDEPGIVVMVEEDHIGIQLDRYFPGLRDWDNQFVVSSDDDMEHGSLGVAFDMFCRRES